MKLELLQLIKFKTMYKIQQKIIDKVNENQEPDVELYAWETIPLSLRRFWLKYLANQRKLITKK